MSLFTSSLRLKTGIVLNLIALTFLVLGWTTNLINTTNTGLIITSVFALLVLLYSYYYSFWQTGLWKFTHSVVPKLNEKEYALSSRALRFAYSVFTIVVLAFLLYSVLTKKLPHIIPVVSLIYFAHILPAVYLGWRR
jgi:hypothetical protein